MKIDAKSAIRVLALLGLALLCNRAEFASAADSSPPVKVKFDKGDTELDKLEAGVKFISNRNITFATFPTELNGLTFARRAYNNPSNVTLEVPTGTTVYILVGGGVNANKSRNFVTANGWKKIDGGTLDGQLTGKVDIYKRIFASSTEINIPGGGIINVTVAAKNLQVLDNGQLTKVPTQAPAPPPESPPSKPANAVPDLHPDAVPDNSPMAGPTTRVAMPQTSIKSLEVQIQESGLMLGQTSEVVLTVTREDDYQALVTVRFVSAIGDQMRAARDEALRYIHLTYPNWYADDAQISFEDKYATHDGGSIGAAVGTMILSVIQGFQIDPDAAITGDISANGKVRAIGGLYAKLHGAIESKCSVVAVPTDNYDQLVDAVIYSGTDLVTDVQVIGISDLDDAVATVRIDRASQLTQAIKLFSSIQADLKNKPTDLNTKDIQQKLAKVLNLAPQHLSAKILLAKAQGKLPKTMSAAASEYFTFVAVNPMVELLAQRRDSSSPVAQIPSVTLEAGLKELQKIAPISDAKIHPLVEAWAAYIQTWTSYQQGRVPLDTAQKRWQIMDDEMKKIDADGELRQKMLKEGI